MTTTPTAEKQKREWNDRYPVGTPVVVIADDGKPLPTTTSSTAWLFGPRTAVVNITGILAPYPLSEVTVREPELEQAAA